MTDKVIDQILNKIINNELNIGDKIPSENELRNIFGVGRSTIRESLKSLDILGLINRDNSGTYISSPNNNILSHLFQCFIALQEISIRDLIQVRLIIEPEIANIACEKVNSEEIEKLEKIYENAKSSKDEKEKMAQKYVDFHIGIAKLTKNEALILIMEMLRPILLKSQQLTINDGKVIKNNLPEKQHKKILDAIKNKNGDEASKIVKEHIRKVYQSLG